MRKEFGIALREDGGLYPALIESQGHERGNNASVLSPLREFRSKCPCHDHTEHRAGFNVFISFAEHRAMKGIQVHLGSRAKGETASFGEIAIVQLDGSSFPGAQIRTEREACPAGCALTLIEDFALQSFKTSVHRVFSNSNRKNRR
jgi:hypothetical protein